jgi:nucleotide-binding universal stress UspA family protein
MEAVMKNILLLVHDDPGQEARFQTALDITRALEGHLTCVDVVQIPALIGDGFCGAGEAMLLADERSREAENSVALKARLGREDVAWDWIDATGDIAQCVLEAAGTADVIVLNRRLDGSSLIEMDNIVAAVAMKARRPVVAVPDRATHFNANGRAFIAWDGSQSVFSTLQACLPLLALASAVHIFAVIDGAEGLPAQQAASYLSRHRIHASIEIVTDGLTAPDKLIAERSAKWHADYCLMGAFHHGRALEAVFGGVSRRMLKESALPLILGH